MQMYAGATAPNSDWLICDGSAVSRTTYATLYAVIGTTFGTGNGSTTFNIPDMRSRMPIGVGTGTGLSARTLAQTSGTETQTIGSANLPIHTHTLSAHTHTSAAHTHTLGGHTHGSAAHTHTLPRATIGTAGTNRLVLSNSPTDNALTTGNTTPGSTGGPSTDSGSTTPGDTGAPSSDTTGNGGFANTALSIMNPFLALNFIIKV
jgi:microcystin-dependent protein